MAVRCDNSVPVSRQFLTHIFMWKKLCRDASGLRIYVVYHAIDSFCSIAAETTLHVSLIHRELEAGHSTECITHVGHSIAFNIFLHFETLWSSPLFFWPNINWLARTRDWLSVWQVDDCSFSHFGFIMRTDTHTRRRRWTPYSGDCRRTTYTHTHTHTHTVALAGIDLSLHCSVVCIWPVGHEYLWLCEDRIVLVGLLMASRHQT